LQNYPNPVNPETEIKFSVRQAGRATLKMYNVLGQQVAVLFDDVAEAGRFYRVRLNAATLASGVYFYKLQAGASSEMRKLLIIR
jgi:hypothetical protein